MAIGRAKKSNRPCMQPEDFNALTTLFTLNINPYGYFSLDFEKPSVLEQA